MTIFSPRKACRRISVFVQFLVVASLIVPSPALVYAQSAPVIVPDAASSASVPNTNPSTAEKGAETVNPPADSSALKNEALQTAVPAVANFPDTSSAQAAPSGQSAAGSVGKKSDPLLSTAAVANYPARTVDPAYRKTVLPEADQTSGALSYAYPIVTPSGRAGMEPSLALVYNSLTTANINTAGYGWDLSLPSIERINRDGVHVMYSQNNYTSSLSGDGQLASTAQAGQYVARVDKGNFIRYAYNTDASAWKAYDKHGTVYSFGSSPNARDGDSENHVARWLVDEMRDANGNYVSYTYVPNDTWNPLISEITYTNHQSDAGQITAGIYKLSFIYERRDDTVNSYRWRFTSSNSHRLKTVEIRAQDTLIKKYDLAYTTGVNGVRSLLSSVTETGYDAQGIAIALPSTTFDYTKGLENPPLDSQGIAQPTANGDFTFGFGSSYYGPRKNGEVYVDINGDGYIDSFLSAPAPDGVPGVWHTIITLNSLGSQPGLVGFPNLEFAGLGFSPSYPVEKGARAADFNGDGFTDLFGIPFVTYNPNCTPQPQCIPPPGVKTLYTSAGADATPETLEFIKKTTDLGAFPIDYPLAQGMTLYVSDIYGSGVPTPYLTPFHLSALDLNLDGLDDAIETQNSSYAINKGMGPSNFKESVPVDGSLPVRMSDMYGNDMGVRFIDINADGLVDILRGWKLPHNGPPGYSNGYTEGDYNEVWINTGNGFVKNTTLKSPYFISIENVNSPGFFGYSATDYVDTNGDGIVDIPNSLTTRTDLLKTIAYPTGGKTAVEYKPTSRFYKPNSSALANPKLPTILWAVSRISTSDGLGNAPHVEDTVYEGGRWFFNSANDKKFAGFEKVTKTDDASVTVTYFHQGNGDNAANGETGDRYGKIGLAYKTEVFDKNAVLLSRTQTVYDQTARAGANSPEGFPSSDPVFVFPSKKIEETYNPADGTHRDRAVEYAYDATNGNLMSTRDDGEVSSGSSAALSSPSFTDNGNDAVVTSIEYASGAGAGVSQTHYETSHQTVTDQNGIKFTEVKSYYDGSPLGSLAKGNQTKQENWIAATTYATSAKSYDGFGMPLSVTDPNGNTTSYAYDTADLYPASVANALNQSAQYGYNYANGKPMRVTDPNGAVLQTSYDGLGRPVDEKVSDPTFAGGAGGAPLVLKTRTAYTDTPNAASVAQTRYLDAQTSGQSITYVDGLGRTIQTRSKTTDTASCAACVIVNDTRYNALGQIAQTSLPYADSGISKTAPTADAALYTVYAYDVLGRVTRATDAVGTTRNDFGIPWTQTTYDALSNRKDYVKDAFGRLSSVNEYNGTATYATNYAYDGAGNQIKITDAQGNIRAFQYDGLGERVFAEDLHAPGDTIFGTYRYTYDSAGNLTRITDVEAKTTSYVYDKLNRRVTEDFNGTPLIDATNFFDFCTNGIGRLCTASNASSTAAYEYNALGAVAKETKTIETGGQNKSFVTSVSYNILGNITAMTHPDGSLIANTYDSLSRLTRIQEKDATSSPFSDIIKSFDYAPTGAVAHIEYANGVASANTYDAGHDYRLTQTKTIAPNNATSTFSFGVTPRNTSYTYDAIGNITDTVDSSDTNTANTTHYAYDALSRLLTASSTYSRPAAHSLVSSFTYDSLGNILTATQNGMTVTNSYQGNLGASYANPHAVTSSAIGSVATSFVYDAHGNLISKGQGANQTTYTWNYNDTLAGINSASSSTSYAYDAALARVSARVKTGATTVTTLYPTVSYSDDGTTRTLHILAPYGPVATLSHTTSPPTSPAPNPLISSRFKITKDLSLVLSSDHSRYTLTSGSTFYGLKFTGNTFTFDVREGALITLISLDRKDLQNSLTIPTTCTATSSTLTISLLPNASSTPLTIMPMGTCPAG